jgi:hypothetical protein
MIPRHEFTVRGLEFSAVLPNKLTWTQLSTQEWPDGWRLPLRWELLLLYTEVAQSRGDKFIWTGEQTKADLAWCVHFIAGLVHFFEKDDYRYIRLVRGNA